MLCLVAAIGPEMTGLKTGILLPGFPRLLDLGLCLAFRGLSFSTLESVGFASCIYNKLYVQQSTNFSRLQDWWGRYNSQYNAQNAFHELDPDRRSATERPASRVSNQHLGTVR